MNIVSKIDAKKAERAEQPDIILGEDWDERVRNADGEDEVLNLPRAGKWMSLTSSPLARKIITFNLMALVVLLGGILYLNQNRESLVDQRMQSLATETHLVARVFEAEMAGAQVMGSEIGIAELSRSLLADLNLSSGVEVFVFDADGNQIASQVGTGMDELDLPENAADDTESAITFYLNRIWDKVSRLFNTSAPKVMGSEDLAHKLALDALGGETRSENVSDARGSSMIAVATPISLDSVVAGALVITTLSGEIDQIVRNDREQILQMFVIAILVSIGLSMVPASTIANPLRDLSAAAELGKDRNAGSISPSRIRIPDMTGRPDEIGRLSGALRGMIAALYDRIESNEQFAADVAHEIKNPLSSLRSAVDTMRIAKTDVQRGRLLDVIEHDVRRLDRLVSDISNASRLDSELVKEDMQAFDLITLLKNLAAHHRKEADEKGVEFIADLPQGRIIVRGLEGRLAQVVVNLLTNAISFCESGDAVRIWARQRENRVLIVIEDTGPGIPAESLTKIFKRFYSERPQNDFGNHSGLGLAISRQIVEAHGGVIWAENIRPTEIDATSEPLGARFVVGLPV